MYAKQLFFVPERDGGEEEAEIEEEVETYDESTESLGCAAARMTSIAIIKWPSRPLE